MSAKKRPNPNALDVTRFDGSPSLELAVVVHRETEAQRAIEAEAFKAIHGKPPTDTLAALLGPSDSPALKTWSKYAQDFDVLERCSKTLGVPIGEAAKRIALELQPENWEALFWMAKWLQALDRAVDLKEQMREQLEAIERSKRHKAVKAAESMHEGRYGAAKRFVQAEWKSSKHIFEGNKSAFARAYVPRVHSEFDLVITHKSIATSWLKGI